MADKIGTFDIMERAAGQMPSAAEELGKEAWAHPVDTALHAGVTLGTSALMGAALGYVIPARGPLGMVVGAAFTIPMVIKGIIRVENAKNEANIAGANVNQVSKDLAKSAVSGTVDLGLNLVGGYYGAEFGHGLANGEGAWGNFAQKTQRLGLKGLSSTLGS